MKAVLLAGGRGTRLYPCTLVVNKHLLPIYDKPMIYYPLITLKNAGCTDVLIIVGGENPDAFMKLLKNGQEFGFNSITYAYQCNPTGGIADALSLAEPFIGKEKFLMILGDNLILNQNFDKEFLRFYNESSGGEAHIFIKEVDNPSSFGVAVIENDKIINIIEKPKTFIGNKAVIGLYMYDYNVFGIIKNIVPSRRGELEITDVNSAYLKAGKLNYSIVTGEWLDTGSFPALYEANQIIFNRLSNN